MRTSPGCPSSSPASPFAARTAHSPFRSRRAFAPPILLALAFTALFSGQPAMAAELNCTREIESVLIKRCSECHGPDQQKAKLRLDSRPSALQGGKSGKPAVIPGDPDHSELLRRIT